MSLFKNPKNTKFLAAAVSLFLLFVLILPILSLAEDTNIDDGVGEKALVRCGNTTTSPGVLTNPCDFTDFIGLINLIIKWIISIAGVIFTISAIYGGFLYMTSGTAIGDKERAKKILYNTILGFVIILVSWLIVYTILNTLIPKDGTSIYKESIFKFIGTGE